MKHIWRQIIIMIVMIILFGTSQVYAKEQKIVKVACIDGTGDFIFDENGEVSGGYTYEYIMKVAAIEGWKIEFVKPKSSDENEAILEMLEKLFAGEVDIMGMLSYSAELEDVYSYPKNSYGNVYTSLLALKSRGDMLLQNNEKSVKVAVYEKAETRRAELETYCKVLNIQYEEVIFETEQETYEALSNGEVDFMLSISLVSHPNTKIVAEFAGRPFYFAAAKGNEQLVAEIDDAIEEIEYTEPEYQEKLHEKYYILKTEEVIFNAEEEAYIKENQMLNVLIAEDNPPFLSVEENERYNGIFISFINHFSDMTGMQINMCVKPANVELSEAVESGKYDIILGIERNDEAAAEQGIVLSETLVDTSMILFYGKSKDISDLSKLTMARQISFAEKNNGESAQIEEYRTLSECIEAVNSGDADFGYGTALEVNYLMSRNGYTNVAAVPVLKKGVEYALAFPIHADMRLISIVNKVIRNIGSDKINAFISESSYSGERETLAVYVKNNPKQAAALLSVFILMLVAAIVLYFFASKIRKQNAVLERAYNAKNDFLSRMSHDMRTPMNAIIGISSLGMQDVGEIDSRKYFENIKISGDYLLGLINDVLDMAKIEKNAIVLYEEPYEMAVLLEQINATVIPLCRQKNITYDFQAAEEDTEYILADRLRFCQIMLNIISNAIKFTPNGGKVTFTVSDIGQKGNKIQKRFLIADTGIGMSADFLKHLFEPFVQEHATGTGTNEGSGLGLSIVDNLVKMMGGTIDIKSVIGEGTSVAVEISFSVVKKEYVQENSESDGEKSLEGMRILLCEDHPLNIKIAEEILKRKGIEVTVAENGEAGASIYAKSELHYFDVILMDIRMPVMDGLEAAKMIRSMNRGDAHSVPIIAMTANAYEDDRQKSMKAGMNEHLAKPIEPDALYRTLLEYAKNG